MFSVAIESQFSEARRRKAGSPNPRPLSGAGLKRRLVSLQLYNPRAFMEPVCLTLWLCRIADAWLDGFALLAVLRTCQATRGSTISCWRQKTLDAAATFNAANMFFRRAIHEGAIDIPGFGAEDLPFHGRVMPLMKPGDRLSNGHNLSLLHTHYLLKNPRKPCKECYRRWCCKHGLATLGDAGGTGDHDSLRMVLGYLNQQLSPDPGFEALLNLLEDGLPTVAAPTEIVCPNPFEPWASEAVPCHPPVLTVAFTYQGFSGVLCACGTTRSSSRLHPTW